jgi:hypothetical protein
MAAARPRLTRFRRRGTVGRPGRFRRMLSNRALWPGMIGVALAVGLGVQMGESAIREIDPVHFQGIPPHPRERGAAIDPNALPPAPQSAFGQAYNWGDGRAARTADSGYEDFDFAPPPAVRRAAAPVQYEAPAPLSLQPWPPGQVSQHPEVERYLAYPVEQKVAPEAPAPAEEDTPPAEEPDGGDQGLHS